MNICSDSPLMQLHNRWKVSRTVPYIMFRDSPAFSYDANSITFIGEFDDLGFSDFS